MSLLRPQDRVLLTGDSITDWGRDRSDPTSLGTGYAMVVASLAGARHPDLGLTFLNRGVGGDTSTMLRDRWQRDALDLQPTVVSILIGVLVGYAQALLRAAQVEVGARELAHDRHLRRFEIRGAGGGFRAPRLDVAADAAEQV